MVKKKRFDIIKAAGYDLIKSKKWFENQYITEQRMLETDSQHLWITYIYNDILGNRHLRLDSLFLSDITCRMKRLRAYIRIVLATPYKQCVEISRSDYGIYNKTWEYKKLLLSKNTQFLEDLETIGTVTGWWKTIYGTKKMYIKELFPLYTHDWDKHTTTIPYCKLDVKRICTECDVKYLCKTAKVLREILSKDVATVITTFIYKDITNKSE